MHFHVKNIAIAEFMLEDGFPLRRKTYRKRVTRLNFFVQPFRRLDGKVGRVFFVLDGKVVLNLYQMNFRRINQTCLSRQLWKESGY